MTPTRKKKKRVRRKTAAKGKDAAVSTQAKPDSNDDATQPKETAKAATTTPEKIAAKKAPNKKAKKKIMQGTGKKKTSRKSDRRPVPARKKAAIRQASDSNQTIHCTLAPTGSISMVLPTSTIAEITDYAPPAPLDGRPNWLLGQVEWEDWQVPVISYSALIDEQAPETATGRSRIMVVKTLSNTARVPYIGVLVKEIPKLAKLTELDLEVTSEGEESPGVHCKVKIAGQKAVIPDLDRLAQLVGHAAYGTVEKNGEVAQA